MKATAGRRMILEAMAKPFAYARPDLSVVGLPPQVYRMKPDMQAIFIQNGLIKESKPPKQEKKLGYIFVITEKGRKWLNSENVTP